MENIKTTITIGMATCGRAAGAVEVQSEFKKIIEEEKIPVLLESTGCIGLCSQEVIIEIDRTGYTKLIYGNVTVEAVTQILERTIKKGEILKEYAIYQFNSDRTGNIQYQGVVTEQEYSLTKSQIKIALKNCGHIDPFSIDDYINHQGYNALKKILEMDPEEVIDDIDKSGIKGRGGAGFPTARKWKFCRGVKSPVKYVICNADEGDPGAFMDRSLLEGDPHSIIEGMIIAGYAIGATEGFIYCRAEYPLALKTLDVALNAARERNLLGKKILNSEFSFDIKIREGAGAFVCGEETSLIASIEDKRGMPKPKPPFPPIKGLYKRPTVVNNVETLANLPKILLNSPVPYNSIGTEKSKGTKVFALAGKVKYTGLIEVPMGMSLRKAIFDVGGGSLPGHKIKAAQLGGPSGGCVPESMFDIPIDYDSINATGAIMGSGGMVVMDETSCMVDIARFFLEFSTEESCGKCTPCRVGTKAMLKILEKICDGDGEMEDIDTLERLSKSIIDSALCGLGKTAPNPVLTTLKYFRNEYEAHIIDKKCQAGVCKRLMPSPCQSGCPAGIDVPSYIALIGHKRYNEALDLILEDNPFPSICGRACPHPCEIECKRKDVDTPVAIMYLKRFVADLEINRSNKIKPQPIIRKEKIAIIGAGPAGLTAANYLIKMGYDVTVFEALEKAGGMLVAGIPEYRLPREIIQAEIDAISAMGVKIKTGIKIGKDLSFDDLKKQEFSAFIMAIGAHTGKKLGIEGEEKYQGCVDSVKFLRDINYGKIKSLKEKVVVVGGGNSAIDAARLAVRLGSKDVTIAYRRTREEMPAFEEEIEAALEEGIKIKYLVSPVSIKGKDGIANGMECILNELGKPDSSGRRRPVPVEGSEFVLPCDIIVPAISQEPEVEDITRETDLKLTRWNTFEVDSNCLKTNVEGVFAAGDAVTGPATIIEAIAAGQRVASAVDRYCRGEELDWVYKSVRPKRMIEELEITDEEVENLKREKMPCVGLNERINSHAEVELGYKELSCINEAKRCLRCDL